VQDVHDTLALGTVVQERYIVEDLLGKGGFGAVYLVRDQRVSGNKFALKEVVDPQTKERTRFTFEGELLKRLDHPALPRVYRTFDDAEHFRAYILMDYIAGPNLEQLRQQQPGKRFAVEQALQIMEPIIGAVSYLHQQHPPIVHRDIKPANIIVPDSGDSAVLVDFGIAKEYDMDATTTAIRRCSPGYGAPEQYASGTNPQTDIYGLAATLYALLTGTVPIDAVFRMTHMGSKRADPLEPVKEHVPSVPQHVSDAIQRAMAIRSEERFATVEEFWQALHAVPIDGERSTDGIAAVAAPAVEKRVAEPVTPAPVETEILAVGPASVVVRKHKRRRGILFAALVALILLALIVGSIFAFGTGHKPQTANSPRPVHTPTATATPRPTATPTAKPTPSPTAVPPTTVPTAPPTAPPAPAYVRLAGSYSGTITNQQANVTTSMGLSGIQQNNAAISGGFSIGSGLLAGNSFSGQVGSNRSIEFIVPNTGSLAPLLFTGQIQSDGSMAGSYCSYRNNYQCDRNAGGWGVWSVNAPYPGGQS